MDYTKDTNAIFAKIKRDSYKAAKMECDLDVVSEEGEECPNFIAKCETEQERDQRIMNGGATIADALSWFKWQARAVATPTTVATMLSRKIIETLEEDIKREEFVRKEMECINDYHKEAQERLKED